MKRDLPDFHSVQDSNLAIHERLTNWARYVRPGYTTWQGPIWKLGKSSGRQWHQPTGGPRVDPQDGHKLEKAVSQLPEKHRDALRWAYVHRWILVHRMRKYLGVTEDGLARLIEEGRTILRNRGV